ncbi:hypothetical protein [Mycolicibacterium obuense]|uniref:Uncharacterized protein n=1 Tax=Mycolicibacterium obuense TaxID=1807 RepID=A0A0J6VD18_9MYCO|nr:hypothetical protein [Mycolicibacterium obuense]KMO68900.1 hypothetical protein MOBUDSM44075_04320 [Mycolicibacterium obuense]
MSDYEDGGVQDIRSTREYLAHFEHRARTPEEQESAFAAYIEASAEDERDTGWHNDLLESRRELFMRRYRRPAPPAGLLPVRCLRDLNRSANNYHREENAA